MPILHWTCFTIDVLSFITVVPSYYHFFAPHSRIVWISFYLEASTLEPFSLFHDLIQCCKLAFFIWSVIVRQTCKPLSLTKGMLKINWDLGKLWKGVGENPENIGAFKLYIAVTWAILKKHLGTLSNLVFVLNSYKSNAN